MKRNIILLLIALFAVFPSMADGLWGAKASFDVNVPGKFKVGDSSTKLYRSGLGFSLGGVYSYFFTDNFFLEPSLSFFYDTYSCDFTIIEEEGAQGVDPVTYKVGLRLPVVFGYTFDITDDFSLSVFTGPELDYAFAGGYRVKNKRFKDEVGSLFGSDPGMQRRFSCSWKGGVGFPFSDWRVDFEAAVGLSDIITGPGSLKENRILLSLVRYF